MAELRQLQERLLELESRMYGGPGGPNGKVADGLVKVQVALGNIASKRERVKTLYKKTLDMQTVVVGEESEESEPQEAASTEGEARPDTSSVRLRMRNLEAIGELHLAVTSIDAIQELLQELREHLNNTADSLERQ